MSFKDSYLDGIRELLDEGYLKDKLDLKTLTLHFDEYLENISRFEKGIELPQDFSPQTEFWLIRDSATYIGTLKIRHKLGNEYLNSVGGHIGYYVRPSERSHGYGDLILALGLIEARQIGLKMVLITCNEGNLRSQKVIEKNGGVYESTVYHEKAGNMRRYWFSL